MTTRHPICRLLYSIILFLGLAGYVQAKVCIAIASGNYNDPTIWSCGAVPAPSDNVVIPANITVITTGNLVHNGTMVIQGTLKVQGDFEIGGNVHVYGTLRVENKLIILGNLYNYTGASIFAGEIEIEGYLENSGDIEVVEDVKVLDGGSVDNFNSFKIGGNLEIEQGATFTNDKSGYLQIFNDLENAGTLNNNTGSTILICDDLENEDNAVINNTGFISICGSCPGAKYEEHELENGDNASILGNGQICMCDANYNAGNTIENNGYIDPNQIISNGTNGNCTTPLAINMHLQAVWYAGDNSVWLQLTLTEPSMKLVIERKFPGQMQFVPIMETSLSEELYVSYEDVSLPKGFKGKVLYRAYVIDEQGDKSFSNTIELQISEENLFAIYPNPVEAGELLTLIPPSLRDKVKITLFSISGQKIMTWEKLPENAPITLQIPNLTRGLYFLNIQQAGIQKQQKLIIK